MSCCVDMFYALEGTPQADRFGELRDNAVMRMLRDMTKSEYFRGHLR